MQSPSVKTPRSGVDVDVEELIRLRLLARGLEPPFNGRARSALAGQHVSRFRGRGVDYLESRAYQSGDDIRNMDWRVTARTGKAHTKLFHEERQRPVILLLDTNPGMFFGSRNCLKSIQAARIASLLAWATARQGDRIGVFSFGSRVAELPPVGGQRGVMQLIRHLKYWYQADEVPQQTENLDQALVRLRRVIRPGSLLVILSDFFHLGEDSQRHLNRIRLHNDAIALRVHDPLEMEVPPPGRYGITDGENVQILDSKKDSVRDQYQHICQQHVEAAENLARMSRTPILSASTLDQAREVLARMRQLVKS